MPGSIHEYFKEILKLECRQHFQKKKFSSWDSEVGGGGARVSQLWDLTVPHNARRIRAVRQIQLQR
jgi:hypothetical protein